MADTREAGHRAAERRRGRELASAPIDGERGILAYRGIDIHALAEQSTFEEVVFLLHRGRLPTRARARTPSAASWPGERPVPTAALALLRALPRAPPTP